MHFQVRRSIYRHENVFLMKILNKKLIIDKFDKYISPKIIWLFEEEKTIEYTALKHLYETGEIR